MGIPFGSITEYVFSDIIFDKDFPAWAKKRVIVRSKNPESRLLVWVPLSRAKSPIPSGLIHWHKRCLERLKQRLVHRFTTSKLLYNRIRIQVPSPTTRKSGMPGTSHNKWMSPCIPYNVSRIVHGSTSVVRIVTSYRHMEFGVLASAWTDV